MGKKKVYPVSVDVYPDPVDGNTLPFNGHTCGKLPEKAYDQPFYMEPLCPECWSDQKTFSCSICGKRKRIANGLYIDSGNAMVVSNLTDECGKVCSTECADMWMLKHL